jgi:hypothetical protein
MLCQNNEWYLEIYALSLMPFGSPRNKMSGNLQLNVLLNNNPCKRVSLLYRVCTAYIAYKFYHQTIVQKATILKTI